MTFTGIFVLQNAQPHFCTETLDRRNYWAELDEILHGTPWGDNSRYYRGIFGYSVWGPRCRVPLGPPGRPKILKNFFLNFFSCFDKNRFYKVQFARKSEYQYSDGPFWMIQALDKLWRCILLIISLSNKIAKTFKMTIWRIDYHYYEWVRPSKIYFDQKKWKNRKKIFFKIFSLLWGPLGYPKSRHPDQISKNPSVIPRIILIGDSMQNFIQFGQVGSSIEDLGTKKWLRIL